MPSGPEVAHYMSSEFLYRNVHYPAGWYFYDEEEDLYGPFDSKLQTEIGWMIYCDQLMRGEAPTQQPLMPGLKAPKL